ncbi:MAG: 30S ribosomal protein S4 [Candidatus Gracilibacteria bacterium]|jgi:small subunit ribosomal protein S4
MGRIIGPACKLCRREGEKLFLKGARCESTKCALTRKNYAPGIHGPKGSFGQKSEYSKQLREKQKAKRIFGIREKQFRNYYKAAETKPGITGNVFLQMLELRLDNSAYKAGFAVSRKQAREIVAHGLLKVNGRKTKTPSYSLKVGMIVEPTDQAKKSVLFTGLEKKKDIAPKWLKVDLKKPSFEVISLPDKNDLQQGVEAQMIVELYSK